MSVAAGKRVLLAARRVGEPKESDFRIESMPVPTAGAGLRESHVHDVTITRESPNYPSGR